MSRIPIRVRLTLAFAVAMAIVLAGVGVLVHHRVGNELLASIDQSLRAQAAEARQHAGSERQLVDQDVTGGLTLAQLVSPSGRVLVSEPGGIGRLLTPADAAAVARGGTVLRSEPVLHRKGEWRVLAVSAGRYGVVVVARPLAARAESLDHLRHELVLFLTLALVISSLAGYGLAAGALRPVEAMRRRAAAVTARRPGRLPVPRSNDEISRLAETLNDMLARLEASFEHERRFVADAAHELRTPLALLRAELELALRRPRSREELEDALRSAAEETERLSRLAEDLLLIARADQGALPIRRERVAAGEVLAMVAARYASIAELEVEESDALLDADPARVEQALGNLVDNALAYGGPHVVLSAVERDDVVELHVSDDGPGFPEEFRELAFDRFTRADEARGRGGTGLGLAIVALIASAHGTPVGLRNRPEGGADVWLAVPRAPAPPDRRRVGAESESQPQMSRG
ncbi:MAG: HAMP domain-containing protein [Actinobacteria bacterium]|nr:HAMP domain-containing protein [Actinomycetota bacterium]